MSDSLSGIDEKQALLKDSLKQEKQKTKVLKTALKEEKKGRERLFNEHAVLQEKHDLAAK